MRRHLTLLALLGLLSPATSTAIDLRWSSGATNIDFVTARRCTLMVHASAHDTSLPQDWRLQYAIESTTVPPVSIHAEQSVTSDTARVCAVRFPAGTEQAVGNEASARLCAGANSAASWGRYILDLPPRSNGKLCVVALDPSDPDSARIIRSGDVTFNGGLSNPFPPVVLHSSTTHPSIPLAIRLSGSGFAQVQAASVYTVDSTWSFPLQFLQQTDSTLCLATDVNVPLPPTLLQLSGSSRRLSLTSLAADEVLGCAGQATDCVRNECYFIDSTLTGPGSGTGYPKDFSLVYNTIPNPWRSVFHLYYIRHRNLTDVLTDTTFSHAWSCDLQHWIQHHPQDDAAFSRNLTSWDNLHVYAPHIIFRQTPGSGIGTYYMFYTGVGSDGHQHVGYATTTLLDTSDTQWTRQSTWIYDADSTRITNWAATPSTYFRDPFVMPDPDSLGRYLLFYVAQNRGTTSDHSVGLARNSASNDPSTPFKRWDDLGFYPATTRTGLNSAESPVAFADSIHATPDSIGNATWRLFFTDGNAGPDSSIRFVASSVGGRISNTSAGNWSATQTKLRTYLNFDLTVYGWEANEELKVGPSFMGACDGTGIGISRMYWNGRDFILKQPSTLAAPPEQDVGSAARLFVSEAVPGWKRVRFGIELPRRSAVKLTLYDVMGRRIRLLASRALLPGVTTIAWDGRNNDGAAAPSGIYFARLSGGFGSRSVKVAFVR